MARVWFRIFLKFVSLTTFVMAIVVIGASSLTIVGIIREGNSITLGYDLQEPETAQTLPGEFSTTPNSIEVEPEPKEIHWKHKVLPKFGKLKGEYKKLVLGCLITTICAGILQLMASLSIILSCSKDVRKKIMYWLIVNLMVFLILIICFTLPLAYDSTQGHRLHFHQITEKVHGHFLRLKEKSVWENIVHELNSYFVAVGINEGLLLIFMILLTTCYCMKCGDYNYQPFS